ncbi:MAG: ThiF family adenylyltransferase [Candidatus Paceibacterota bacterium]
MDNTFSYDEAFSRNLGLLTREEQDQIKDFTIAIPGMGGVGGAHLIALVRQGFQKFKIADFDAYALNNFNRQYGARVDTIGQKKGEIMKGEALKINPNCTIEVFSEGINDKNINDFLAGVDLSVDALDAFAVDARRLYFNRSLQKKIPVITAGPIGFGTAFLIFKPGGPNFDDYFQIKDTHTEDEKIMRFLVGLVPSLLQRPYLKDADISERRGPSSIGAVQLCSGVVVLYALKILLNKGTVKAVPYYHQFDVMQERYIAKRLWFGNAHPIQRLKLLLAKHFPQLLVKD